MLAAKIKLHTERKLQKQSEKITCGILVNPHFAEQSDCIGLVCLVLPVKSTSGSAT